MLQCGKIRIQPVPDTFRQDQDPGVTLITPSAPIANPTHGGRAKCLQRLVRLDLPVPRTVAIDFDTVHRIAHGSMPNMERILDHFLPGALLCVRPSSEDPDWGGPGSVLNIGMNDAAYVDLSDRIGADAASSLYQRFVVSFAIHVARLDPDVFEEIEATGQQGLSEALSAYD